MTSPFPARIRHFVDSIQRDYPDFNSNLNRFFDSIGFTRDFPPVYARGPLLRSHAVKDNVWGMIEFDEPIRRLIDSPLVQRLRGIRQNGLTHLTYPTATHTRFAHTLGVYSATSHLLSEIDKTHQLHRERTDAASVHAATLNPKTVEILKRAAVLHDVGHGPYSHVSERLFGQNHNRFSLAGVPLDDLLRRFRLEYIGVKASGTARPSGGKPLSELVSVLLICSDRFRHFYDHILEHVDLNEEHDIFNISTLILGDRLTEDDLATPAIISSAIDADKIDYMLRDAKACGISLTIDPSRTFQGAGVYRLPVREDPYFGEKTLTDTSEVNVFVIDKSGSDTYFQIGLSRLSLYSRIYHHPLTRNAEFHFADLMTMMQDENNELRDVLSIWRKSEGELLHSAQSSSNASIKAAANAFIWRSFPKRAANLELGSLTFCFSRNHTSKFDSNFASLVTDTLYPIFESHDFVDSIEKRIRTISRATGVRIAKNEAINLRFIPPPSSEDAVIGNTRLIDRASRRLVKCEFHVPSYLQAGALAERRSYIVVREGLREISAVATAAEILTRALARPSAVLQESDPKSGQNGFWPKRIHFLPILDMEKVSNTCKISQTKITEILTSLEQLSPSDPIPRLLNRPKASTGSMAAVDKFSQFEGAKGWKIDQTHVLNFLAQFPSRLRDDTIRLLDKLEVFDRVKICRDIQKALDRLFINKHSGRTFVVPFTMNSGHVAVSYLRDSVHFPDASWILKDSLRAALAETEPGDWIVFIDDHAASGTQVRRRLYQWINGGDYSGGDTQLEPLLLKAFAESKIAFAFAAMAESGVDVIVDTGKELGLQIAEVTYGTPFKDYSLRKFALSAPELRAFLEIVGTGLMLPRFHDHKGPLKRAVADAAAFSLGYRNAEGGLVTELNVPTSTYTCLWRPGFFDPTGKYRRNSDSNFPWMPLFIRSSHIDDVILF